MRDVENYRTPYYVERYRTIRHRPKEVFDSERHFLPRCLRPGQRVLDVGCACGGFYNILRQFDPSIEYLGVDISEVLVQEARRLYPQGRFEVMDGTSLALADAEIDLVQIWGVTLHEPDWQELLRNAWRVAQETLLFDIRLIERGEEINDLSRGYTLNPGGVANYYIVVPGADLGRFLADLEPRPARVEMYGYPGRPNKHATLPPDTGPIYMTAVGVFKGAGEERPTVFQLDVPGDLVQNIRLGLAGRPGSLEIAGGAAD